MIRNEMGRQFACAENIDIQIGRVLDRLETMGELENTVVVYTSDHGIAIGRHGLMGKQNLYEHSWRVPMIAAGPGIAEGLRVKGNVYLGDPRHAGVLREMRALLAEQMRLHGDPHQLRGIPETGR